MNRCIIASVGKLKVPHWREAAESYRKKLRQWKIEEVRVRDGDAALPPAARNRQEGERLLAALAAITDKPGRSGNFLRICLDEHGESVGSLDLAALLEKCALEARTPCFVVGGAYGLAEEVLNSCQRKISLSRLTFTHELAQVVLWEQLYRADSIMRGTGYHHE